MPYSEIQNFKFGLDTRRSELTSQMGVLETLENAHINQGGESEKRKSFSRFSLPSQTYGWQETTTGISVFGSRDVAGWAGSFTIGRVNLGGGIEVTGITIDSTGKFPPVVGDPIQVSGSSVAGVNGDFVIAYIIGSGPVYAVYYFSTSVGGPVVEVTTVLPLFIAPTFYVRLQHPLGYAMTGVISSRYYNGKTFAITTWANGDTLVFYGTDIIKDFYVGASGTLEATPYAMVQDLVAEINASGRFTATQAALPAFLQFTITGGSNGLGNQVTYIGYNFHRGVSLIETSGGGAGSTDSNSEFWLLFPAYVWGIGDTTATVAQAIVNQINAGGTGNLWGFVASRGDAHGLATNVVCLVPPATDAAGNVLGLNALDTLDVTPGGNVTLYNPPPSESFDVFSIPSTTSPNSFAVTPTVVDASLTFKLVSSGVAGTAGVGAVGQFTVIAGSSNQAATGTLTIGANVVNGTVSIGNTTYTFVTTLTGTANEVLIDLTATNSLQNLVAAINLTAGQGTTYSEGTIANGQVVASAVVAGVTNLTASVGGTIGNLIGLSTTLAAITVSGAYLTGGGPDTNQITSITVGTTDLLNGTAVPYNATPQQTASDLVTVINANQGTSGFNATANNATVSVLAINPGASVNEAVLSIVSAGNVCLANCYIIINGLAGGTMNSITVNGTNIMTAVLTYLNTESIAAFTARVAANINANSGTAPKWLACAVSNQLFMSPVTITSADATPAVIATSSSTPPLTITEGTTTALSASGNLPVINFATIGGGLQSVNSPLSAVVTATGGIAPYTYNWTFPGGSYWYNSVYSNGSVIALNNDNTTNYQSWEVSGVGAAGVSFIVQCTVTDAASNTVTVNFTLLL